MAKYRVVKDDRYVGTLDADDAREAGCAAVMKWGHGIYDVSLVRGAPPTCEMCGEELNADEEAEGICESCYMHADNGDDEP